MSYFFFVGEMNFWLFDSLKSLAADVVDAESREGDKYEVLSLFPSVGLLGDTFPRCDGPDF